MKQSDWDNGLGGPRGTQARRSGFGLDDATLDATLDATSPRGVLIIHLFKLS